MRLPVSCTALGLVLVVGASTANAQTVIAPAVVNQPLLTVPAATVVQPETVQTTETVRTVRRVPLRSARRQVVTTRTITRRIVPATTIVAHTVPATPQPLYDEVVPAPIASAAQPLYDEVAVPMAGGTLVGSEPYTYRYVYQPDRILVIDPATGIAVQSIPR